jgi:hypothetical protein
MTVVTRERDVHRHALAAQAAGDRVGQGFFVLDYQNSHETTIPYFPESAL